MAANLDTASVEQTKNGATDANDRKSSLESKVIIEDRFNGLEDRLKKKALIRFLKRNNILDKVQFIYKSPNSKQVTLITEDEATSTFIAATLLSQYYIHVIKQSHSAHQPIARASLPSLLFYYILGAKVPFERNAICGNKAEALESDLKRLAGDKTHQYQIILPFLETALSPKYRHHIIKTLQSLTPESFRNLTALPTQEELFARLEQEAQGTIDELEKLFAHYEEYVWDKDSETGFGFKRPILDDFEFMIKLFNKMFKETPEFAVALEEGLRKPQSAVVADTSVLYQTLIKMETQEEPDFALKPSAEIAAPKLFQENTVSLPLTLDVPKSQYDDTHTVFVIDVSGSMGQKGNGGNGGLEAIKKELANLIEQLARKPNQYITLVAYSSDARPVMIREKVALDTMQLLIQKVSELQVDAQGGTAALPALREAWKHLREKENINFIFGTDGKFDDAEERAKFAKSVHEIYHSNPKIPLPTTKVFGLGLEEDSEEQIYLKTLTSLAEEDSQLVFSSAAEIGARLKQLVMSEKDRMIVQAQVTVVNATQGSESYQTSIRPFASNEPTDRFLDIPRDKLMALLEATRKAGKEHLTLKFDLTFDNQEKVSFEEQLSLAVFAGLSQEASLKSGLKSDTQSPRVLSFYERTCYRNEWIKDALYREGLERPQALFAKSYAEQIALLENVLKRASLLQNKEIMEKLQADLQVIVKNWLEEQKFSICKIQNKHTKYKTLGSAAKVKVLDEIQKRIQQFSPALKLVAQNLIKDEKEIEDIQAYVLEKALKFAKVSSQLIFDKVRSPQEQLEAYSMVKKEGGDQRKFDQNKLNRFIDQKIEKLWLKAMLLKAASDVAGKTIKLDSAFKALEPEQQYSALDTVRQIAIQEGKNEAVFKQLNELMGIVFLETRIRDLTKCKSEQEFREKFNREKQFEIYRKIEQEEEASQYPEVMEVLSDRIFNLWLDIEIGKTLLAKGKKVTGLATLNALSCDDQLKILEEINQLTKEQHMKDFAVRITAVIEDVKLRSIIEQKQAKDNKNAASQAAGSAFANLREGGAIYNAVSKPRYLKRTRHVTSENSLLADNSDLIQARSLQGSDAGPTKNVIAAEKEVKGTLENAQVVPVQVETQIQVQTQVETQVQAQPLSVTVETATPENAGGLTRPPIIFSGTGNNSQMAPAVVQSAPASNATQNVTDANAANVMLTQQELQLQQQQQHQQMQQQVNGSADKKSSAP